MFARHYNQPVKYFVELHNKAFPHASKSTTISFRQTLKRLEKVYGDDLEKLDLIFLNDPNELYKKLSATDFSPNTITTTFTSVIKLLKMIDAPLNIYNSYVNKNQSHSNKLIEEKKEKMKSLILPNWETIQDKFLSYEVKDSYIDMRNYLFMSFFILQPPIRVSNYSRLKYITSDNVPINQSNYLVNNDGKFSFVFNKYRTSHIQGTRVLDIEDDFLIEYLKLYIATYKIKEGDFLIAKNNINNTPVTQKDLTGIFLVETHKIFGEAYNSQDLRTMFLRTVMENDPKKKYLIDVAEIMGFGNYKNMIL